ncbi:MAG: CBS domain-containing protein, partial [Methyloprofundus sp.]|nr:CBS domain-containing protein [Methyloprofundus sp.]
MPGSRPQDHSEFNLEQIMNDLDNGALYDARGHLHKLFPAEIALLLRSLPIDYRYQLWGIMAPEAMGQTLAALHGEVRIGLIERTSATDLVVAASQLEPRDMADLVTDFPEDVRGKILQKEGDSRLEAALSYDGHTAGGLMSMDALPIRGDVTVDETLTYLRAQKKMPANMDSLVVVGRNNRYLGMVAVATILTSDPQVTISTLMDSAEAISLNMPVAEVASIFEFRNILSAAVVDEQSEVIGRITLEEVLDVIREEADHAVLSSAGLDEEHDLFAPVMVSARRRAVWLGVNLFTAFLASWVIGLFEATISQIVALAV